MKDKKVKGEMKDVNQELPMMIMMKNLTKLSFH